MMKKYDGIVLLSPEGVHYFHGANIFDMFHTLNGAIWFFKDDLYCTYNEHLCMFKGVKLGGMSKKAFLKVLRRGNRKAFDSVTESLGS